MRWRRVYYRYHVAMLVGCALLVGFYAGRVSLVWKPFEVVILGGWFANTGYWLWCLRRHLRREHEEFKREMRQTAEEIIRRRFQEEIDGDS